jgi:hypothetical protein
MTIELFVQEKQTLLNEQIQMWLGEVSLEPGQKVLLAGELDSCQWQLSLLAPLTVARPEILDDLVSGEDLAVISSISEFNSRQRALVNLFLPENRPISRHQLGDLGDSLLRDSVNKIIRLKGLPIGLYGPRGRCKNGQFWNQLVCFKKVKR